MIELLPLLKGALTYVPGIYDPRRFDTTDVGGARYCYSVWLRHLVASERFAGAAPASTVAELGPGPSLGVVIAAALTGAERLYALDVVAYATVRQNQEVLAGLVDLLSARAPIPADDEFPGLYPKLDDYRFPGDLLTPSRLAASLSPARVRALGDALGSSRVAGATPTLEYRSPWYEDAVVEAASVELCVSQAVLEHVDDLAGTHAAIARWLAPGGLASHVVDLRSHRLTRSWDGHLQYSPLAWQLVRGRRPYLINRVSPSNHVEHARHAGFDVLLERRYPSRPELAPGRVHPIDRAARQAR